MTEQRIDEIELDAVKLGKRVKTARNPGAKSQGIKHLIPNYV